MRQRKGFAIHSRLIITKYQKSILKTQPPLGKPMPRDINDHYYLVGGGCAGTTGLGRSAVPVSGTIHTAALEVMLDSIPGVGHTLMTGLA